MARLSKEQLGDRGRFVFKQEDVELPEISGDDGEPGSVLVRTPSVGQRDALAKQLPDDEKDWTIDHTAVLFNTIVVDPQLTVGEAKEFLADWPGTALDKIVSKWTELVGSKEEMRESASDFRTSD